MGLKWVRALRRTALILGLLSLSTLVLADPEFSGFQEATYDGATHRVTFNLWLSGGTANQTIRILWYLRRDGTTVHSGASNFTMDNNGMLSTAWPIDNVTVYSGDCDLLIIVPAAGEQQRVQKGQWVCGKDGALQCPRGPADGSCDDPVDVPTLTEWGLIFFAFCLLLLMTLVFLRRKEGAGGSSAK
jgi:hypothetical protein